MTKMWDWIKSPGAMAAAGLIGLFLAIYTAFFYEKKPELTIRVETLSPVFDIRQPVGGLSVSYAGEDLRSARKALWVLKATISNTGNAELKKGDYDDRAPLGLNVTNAEIVDRPSITTTNQYLEQNLQVIAGKSGVTLTPAILEPGDTVELTLLLLGPDSDRPDVKPVGKIAGIRNIVLIGPNSPEDPTPVWRQAVRGDSLWVHLLRGIIYFVGTILSLVLISAFVVLIISPFDSLSKRRSKQERQKKIQKYRRHEELGNASRFLIEKYVEEGFNGFKNVAYAIEKHRLKQETIASLRDKTVPDAEIEPLLKDGRYPGIFNFIECTKWLRDAKLLEGSNLETKLSADAIDALTELAKFLEIDLEKSFSYYEQNRDFLYFHDDDDLLHSLHKERESSSQS